MGELRAANLVLCCCGRARVGAWGGARPALGHNTNTPSLHWRMLGGRTANTTRGQKRAGRAPQDSSAGRTAFRSPCRQPTAVLLRSSSGGRPGEEHAPRWATTQSRQVHTGTCSVGGRPILHGPNARWPRAAGCGRGRQDHRRPCCQPAPVMVRLRSGGRREEERAPRWGITQPRRVQTAWPACSARGPPILHGEKSARAVR
jgi:hypothetical protein